MDEDAQPGVPTRKVIMVVYGTRPEAIKLAPVMSALAASPAFTVLPVVTGQHREMLDQVNDLFGIKPVRDLDVILPRQSLSSITSRTLERLQPMLSELEPDAVVVQGDTTSAMAAGLAAFYAKIPVFHVEAGLRTGNMHDPFPEEINRRVIGVLTSLHLAPTQRARDNLLSESVASANIVVTGNTAIDALIDMGGRLREYEEPRLRSLTSGRRILVTAHRRESIGEPMRSIGRAVARLADLFPDITIVLPAHRNPAVREDLLHVLGGHGNVVVTDPLRYDDMVRLMTEAHLIITDSGGVQEEAPSLGKPVLVVRETTERPEAIAAGTARLIGTDENAIVDATTTLLTDSAAYEAMSQAVNPYGDGNAAARICAAVEHYFGLGPLPVEFDPDVAWVV